MNPHHKEIPVTIYSPEPVIRQPFKLLHDMFSDLSNARQLAARLAIRDISAQYRQTFLGYIWAFILPLVNTATWLFLSSSGIVRLADTGMPYTVYVLSGTMLWQIFTESLQSPLQEVGGAKAMLAKLNFPREALILSGILKTLFNAGIKMVLLIPAIVLLGVYPDWHIIFFPFGVLSIMLVGLTIGLALSPIGMLYTDISKAIPIVTQFAMYVTPVVFMMPTSGITAKIFEYNFMTPLIQNARNWLTATPVDSIGSLMTIISFSLVLFFFSWIAYRITMPRIIERMSS